MKSVKRKRSIASLLSVWYAGSAFLLLAGGTGFLYFALTRSFDRENTEYVTEKTRTLETLLREHPGQQATVQWEVQGESLAHPSIRVFSRVLGADRKVLVETAGMSSDLPVAVFPDAVNLNAPDVETRDIRTSSGRAYRLAATKASGTQSDAYTLQVAVDLTFEKDLLAGYRRQLWVVLGLGLFASILIGRRIAIRGLRPLHEISETVRQIRSTNLHEHVPLDRGCLNWRCKSYASMIQQHARYRLGDSFERLSRFSSDIAHELRTPLTNLRGEIDLALSKKRSPDEYADLLGSLSEECEQLARIIDSLLFLARAEQPAMQIKREPLDIGHELRLVSDFYEPAAVDAGVHLTVDAPELLESQIDRTLFQRAVGNLVQNALAHTPVGGEIQIAASNGAGQLVISVSDTGSGIPEADLPRVFDRFYRADPARTRNKGGCGLGLPIVQSIARLHGGTVGITSKIGRGQGGGLNLPASDLARIDSY